VTAEISDGLDGFRSEVLHAVEGGIDAMDGRAWLHLFCPLAKCVQLLSLAGVELNVRFTQEVFVSHDEEEDGPVQPLGFIELVCPYLRLMTPM
jgi:hypothetical protein